jgi:hypothetical protein
MNHYHNEETRVIGSHLQQQTKNELLFRKVFSNIVLSRLIFKYSVLYKKEEEEFHKQIISCEKRKIWKQNLYIYEPPLNMKEYPRRPFDVGDIQASSDISNSVISKIKFAPGIYTKIDHGRNGKSASVSANTATPGYVNLVRNGRIVKYPQRIEELD